MKVKNFRNHTDQCGVLRLDAINYGPIKLNPAVSRIMEKFTKVRVIDDRLSNNFSKKITADFRNPLMSDQSEWSFKSNHRGYNRRQRNHCRLSEHAEGLLYPTPFSIKIQVQWRNWPVSLSASLLLLFICLEDWRQRSLLYSAPHN